MLLVETVWALLQCRNAKNDALYNWAMRITAKRSRSRTCIALTRNLVGMLYAIWRDGTEFNPRVLRHSVTETVAAA